MSLPQMKNLGVSLDLRGTLERILFHTGFLKGQGVPLHRNRAGHLTLDVIEICKKAKASAHKGRQLHAASSFPPIAAEPAIPPPASEKRYRLPAGQKVPPAQQRADQRAAVRNEPEVKGPEERGAEPPPPVPPGPAEGSLPPLPPQGDEEVLPQGELTLDGLVPPPLVKLHQKFSKRTELLKLHLKHYHMSTALPTPY